MSLSKSAKKNAKKREKRRQVNPGDEKEHRETESEKILLKDPVIVLKERLNVAKTEGDHKLAAKLRQDLWVLQDVNSGHKPAIDEEELDNTLECMEDTSNSISKNTFTISSGDYVDKDIKKLKKKLIQIEKLKKLRDSGENMEVSQLEKISKEDDILAEIKDLEKLISSVKITK